jgi:hypothetical protein
MKGGLGALERELAEAIDRREVARAAAALLALGEAYARAGDARRAAPCFERAIGIDGAPLEVARAAAARLSALVREAAPAAGAGADGSCEGEPGHCSLASAADV